MESVSECIRIETRVQMAIGSMSKESLLHLRPEMCRLSFKN